MHAHLVAYEYGNGQAWGYVVADSAAEIAAELPDLEVYDEAPDWLTAADLERVRTYATVKLSDPTCVDRILHGAVSGAMALAS